MRRMRRSEPPRRLPHGRATLARILRDERGDEGVNKILIIALVSIPLVLVLIFFGQEIVDFLTEAWADISGQDKPTIVNPRQNPFGR